MKSLDKLRKQYKVIKTEELNMNKKLQYYLTMRLFCIEYELLTFNEVEIMEYEVNIEVNNSPSF